jgi:hypothetical protein
MSKLIAAVLGVIGATLVTGLAVNQQLKPALIVPVAPEPPTVKDAVSLFGKVATIFAGVPNVFSANVAVEKAQVAATEVTGPRFFKRWS